MRTFLTLLALACSGASAADFGSDDLVRQGRLVFEKTFTQAEQDRLTPLVVGALDNIVAFYGERKGTTPDFFFCKSTDCARHLAGKDWRSFTTIKPRYYYDGKYYFERTSVVINHLVGNPKIGDARLQSVLTHELSHVEIYARAGGRSMPAWFNEGLSTVAEGRNCQPGTQGIEDLNRLADTQEWHDYTRPNGGKGDATYCQATLEVQAWAGQHGGFAAVFDLLAKLPKKNFNSLYGALVTQHAPVANPANVEKNDG